MSESTCYIGIDPGLTGAVAFVYSGGARVQVVPTIKLTATKRDYDILAMWRSLECAGWVHVFACIERASPRPAFGERCPKCKRKPAEGTVSSFRSGYGYGIWHALLAARGIPLMAVPPRTWKLAMLAGVDKTDQKAASIVVAKRLFPSVPLRHSNRCTVDNHNMAEALLIGEFGKRSRVIG